MKTVWCPDCTGVYRHADCRRCRDTGWVTVPDGWLETMLCRLVWTVWDVLLLAGGLFLLYGLMVAFQDFIRNHDNGSWSGYVAGAKLTVAWLLLSAWWLYHCVRRSWATRWILENWP